MSAIPDINHELVQQALMPVLTEYFETLLQELKRVGFTDCTLLGQGPRFIKKPDEFWCNLLLCEGSENYPALCAEVGIRRLGSDKLELLLQCRDSSVAVDTPEPVYWAHLAPDSRLMEVRFDSDIRQALYFFFQVHSAEEVAQQVQWQMTP